MRPFLSHFQRLCTKKTSFIFFHLSSKKLKYLENHFIEKLEKLSGFIMLGPFSSGHCSVRTVVGLAFFYEHNFKAGFKRKGAGFQGRIVPTSTTIQQAQAKAGNVQVVPV